MIEDSELLQAYAEKRSEAAFAELVRRRVGLVYSVALRQVGGDSHLAQDVTQRVFTDLAQKAPALASRRVLSGWLYRSAQFAASDLVRSERRRRAREQENLTMNATAAAETEGGGAMDWDKLRPVLDEAMAALGDEDRDAVALRFLEEKPFAEIGRRLAISEEAARKRVSRALEKLHAGLAQRGITSTTAAVALALGNQAASAVPAGLAASVTAAAVAGTATWAGATITFMSTKLFGIGAATVAAAAIGVAVVENQRSRRTETELTALTGRQQVLQAKLAETERRAAEADEDAAKLLAAVQTVGVATPTRAADSEPITHEGVLARWRRAQALARTGDPAEALRELQWCLDIGMVQVGSFSGVRTSALLSELAKLGERHPEALAFLRGRREQTEKRVLAGASDFATIQLCTSINRTLKEPERTLAVFDQLPPGDTRRRPFALAASEPLREQRRYNDAMEGQTVLQIMTQFDLNLRMQELPIAPETPKPDLLIKQRRSYAITSTAKNIEVLAGVGKLDDARRLSDRLLTFDGTPETRTLLQAHLARAGQPNLLPAPAQ